MTACHDMFRADSFMDEEALKDIEVTFVVSALK